MNDLQRSGLTKVYNLPFLFKAYNLTIKNGTDLKKTWEAS